MVDFFLFENFFLWIFHPWLAQDPCGGFRWYFLSHLGPEEWKRQKGRRWHCLLGLSVEHPIDEDSWLWRKGACGASRWQVEAPVADPCSRPKPPRLDGGGGGRRSCACHASWTRDLWSRVYLGGEILVVSLHKRGHIRELPTSVQGTKTKSLSIKAELTPSLPSKDCFDPLAWLTWSFGSGRRATTKWVADQVLPTGQRSQQTQMGQKMQGRSGSAGRLTAAAITRTTTTTLQTEPADAKRSVGPKLHADLCSTCRGCWGQAQSPGAEQALILPLAFKGFPLCHITFPTIWPRPTITTLPISITTATNPTFPHFPSEQVLTNDQKNHSGFDNIYVCT